MEIETDQIDKDLPDSIVARAILLLLSPVLFLVISFIIGMVVVGLFLFIILCLVFLFGGAVLFIIGGMMGGIEGVVLGVTGVGWFVLALAIAPDSEYHYY